MRLPNQQTKSHQTGVVVVVGAGEVNSRADSRGPSTAAALCHIQLLLTGRNRFGTVVDRYLNDRDAKWIF